MNGSNETHNKRPSYEIRIDNQAFTLESPEPTGRELLALVGKTPDKFILALIVKDEPERQIDPGETFDISRPGVEEFALVSKERFYSFRIDEESFQLSNQTPTGRELLALVGKSPENVILTISLDHKEDDQIDPDEKVDLAHPGREQFYTVAKKPLAIVIDDVTYHPSKKELTGAELRHLPSPPVSDTRDLWLDVPGRDDLRVQPGDVVKLKDGMVFYTAPSTINPGGAA